MKLCLRSLINSGRSLGTALKLPSLSPMRPVVYTMLLRLLLLTLTAAGAVCRRPEVTVANGTLLGSEATVDGRRVWQFLGIPFAEPPIASLRLLPPRPIRRQWSEPLVADTPPSGCLQPAGVDVFTVPEHLKVKRSEDCLYLDVWTPALGPSSTDTGGAKRPVAVWIHGGSFMFGEGLPLYQGRALAALGDLVVVVVQYRLGFLGFARLDPELVPGNLGLLDQQAALLWVQENIGAFGGDPDAVTLFGESAGAASVANQAMNADSARYFRRAVLQSGSPLNFWACNPKPDGIERYSRQGAAKYLNCGQSDAKELLECLQGKSEEEVADAMSKIFYDEPPGSYGTHFKPVVDGRFILSHPWEAILAGEAPRKDLILGVTDDEAIFLVQAVATALLMKSGFPKNVTNRFDEFLNATMVRSVVRAMLCYYPSYPQTLSSAAFKAIDAHSLSHVDPSRTRLNAERLLASIGEVTIYCGMNSFADAVAAVHDKVYFFELAHRPSTPFFPRPKWMSSAHGDDIPFMFYAPLQHPELEQSMDEEEQLLSRRMIGDFAAFAKTGRPRDPNWRPYTLKRKEFYRYGIASTLQEGGVRRDACAFWDHVLPLLNGLSCDEESDRKCSGTTSRPATKRSKPLDEL